MSYRSNLSPREYAVLKARTARMARNAATVVASPVSRGGVNRDTGTISMEWIKEERASRRWTYNRLSDHTDRQY